MIASGIKRIVKAGKDTLPLMMYCRNLAVHHPLGADHIAAKSFADALMTKAYAQQRDLAGKVFDCVN